MEQQTKQPPVFIYNKNYDTPDTKDHFFATQIQTLVLAIFITGMMQLSNHLAIYLIYCCPMYFFIVLLQWLVFWKPKRDLSFGFNIYNLVMFIICLPIFFGVFFAVFHPTASLEFKQAQNCQLIGKQSKWIEFTEKYSILYINFEYEGKQYLGQACASNFYQADTTDPIFPYQFYYKYDKVQCGPIDKNFTDPQYPNRMLSQNDIHLPNSYNNQRILKRGGGSRGGGSRGSSRSSSCYRSYLWSKVKIASWLCMDSDFDEEDYMQPQSCYVNFFNGDMAAQNGEQRQAMKDQNSFPLIAFKSHAYFPEIDLVCLIIFSYYNWILSFNSLFQYPAYYLLKKISNKNNQKVIPLEIQPQQQQSIQQELQQNQLQPIQQEQQNKFNLEYFPYLVQINQQLKNNNLDNNNDYAVQSLMPQSELSQLFQQQPDPNQVPIHTKDGLTHQYNLQKDYNSAKSCND
ncbi:transmembrane protein, putative (macronuclear) [Tetrahymena thermophila SB210]|uniref:Transmembrane protein, putative n=1 Tax=Tetrahymena thermophila (strain SB210) TaxID=312017 RepID=Q236W8_TETTS|nr:transmembrane protein, putative [Tetrahymena thermophila SB210]EAR92382.2 transmembrane protein, putative [Tetrahymena thermophila SB210]|eukprot:XP_001012627.2 transmembrane protein, putative [Tetrahymena thermophila SB210]